MAAAVPYIDLGDISQLSRGYREKRKKKQPAILPFNTGVAGPGTGLGVALLAHINGEHIPIPSEGGHTTFSPEDARQQAYYDYLRENVTQDRAPDIELVASGKGMVNIFRFLDKGELPNNRDYRRFTENVIRARANREWKRFAAKLDKLKDSEAGIELRKAYQGRFFHPVFDYMVEMFLEGLGQGIRHTANAFACYDGGVFIEGGNARRLTKEIKSSEHLSRSLRLVFPDSHREKIANMPIFLIEGDANKYAGTLGSAVTSFKDAGYI